MERDHRAAEDGAEGDRANNLATALDAWVEGQMRKLYDQAERVRTNYDTAVDDAQAQQQGRRARIGVRVRRQRTARAGPGAFAIEWVTYHFLKGVEGKQYRTTYIPRGDGDSYPRSAFALRMPTWQRPLVLAAERQMTELRRQSRELTELRMAVRRKMRQCNEAARHGED